MVDRTVMPVGRMARHAWDKNLLLTHNVDTLGQMRITLLLVVLMDGG